MPVQPIRRAPGRRSGFARVTTALYVIVLVGVMELTADLGGLTREA